MWWPILIILAQFAGSAVPAWAVLWLVDRLSEGPADDPGLAEFIARDLGRLLEEGWDRLCVHGTGEATGPEEPLRYSNLDAAYAKYLAAGVMTYDEAREAMGLPPLPGR